MLDKKINKMEESPKLVWVEGTSKIQCNIKHVEKSILNMGNTLHLQLVLCLVLQVLNLLNKKVIL